MLHLLKIEWLKIKNYRAFWIFVALYLASIFLVNYITYSIYQSAVADKPALTMISGYPFAFPSVWGTVGWVSSWVLYFPGMIMIMLMVNEFNFKTHRQNVIDGLSRNQFIMVKIAMALILAAIITLINFFTGLFFGFISSGHFSTDGMINIVYIFLQSVAYIFFALMLAVLLRRSGIAMGVFFLYGLIFEWVITAFTTFKLHLAPAGYFLPLQASDVLIPSPFNAKIIYPNAPSPYILVIAIIIYISIYIFFARRKFLRDDL